MGIVNLKSLPISTSLSAQIFPPCFSTNSLQSIKPKPGQLIVFLNDNNSFHGVEKMKNHSQSRDFIYGGYTILSGKNPFIKSNFFKMESRTGFHIYD